VWRHQGDAPRPASRRHLKGVRSAGQQPFTIHMLRWQAQCWQAPSGQCCMCRLCGYWQAGPPDRLLDLPWLASEGHSLLCRALHSWTLGISSRWRQRSRNQGLNSEASRSASSSHSRQRYSHL
jgi:hypothetical protein